MKYKVNINIVNKKDLSQRSICETFTNGEEAVRRKNQIIDELKEHEYSPFKRVIPVVTCKCGEKIECINFTNTCCECEADYNFSGDLLAPRNQWGEETGEHWTDCY
jgi:hypothetical protein